MPEEFVRKEVYEADLRRMDQRFDSMEKRMDERFEGLQTSMREGFALINERMEKNLARYEAIALETRGEVRALTAHITTMEYWGAIVVGAATIAFAIAQYFQSKRETIATKVREEVNELRKTVLALAEAGRIAAPRG